jgi:hypothetical protein
LVRTSNAPNFDDSGRGHAVQVIANVEESKLVEASPLLED